MLAYLNSSLVALGVIFGVPLVVGAIAVMWARPRRGAPLWSLLSLVGVGLIAFMVWSVVRPQHTYGPVGLPVAGAVAPSAAGPTTGGQPGGAGTPPGSPPGAAACSPSGTTLHQTAKGVAFQSSCLGAPANAAFTIVFSNQDPGIPHDIHIFSTNPTQNPAARSLFTGSLVTGPNTVTYHVQGLPPGTYYFHCDVHPTQMQGVLVVK